MKRWAKALLVVLLLPACRASEPPNNPEEVCIRACAGRAAKRCTQNQCERGCRLSLDRLVEHEGDPIIACVADNQKVCDDAAWAECAVRVGVHADGGPPAPVRKGEDEDEP